MLHFLLSARRITRSLPEDGQRPFYLRSILFSSHKNNNFRSEWQELPIGLICLLAVTPQAAVTLIPTTWTCFQRKAVRFVTSRRVYVSRDLHGPFIRSVLELQLVVDWAGWKVNFEEYVAVLRWSNGTPGTSKGKPTYRTSSSLSRLNMPDPRIIFI